MDVIEKFAKNFTLSSKNADPNNWKWDDESKAIWKLAGKKWRAFGAKWYGATDSQSASLVDPESPSLSLEPLPSHFNPDTSSIVVRASYVRMFDIVWAKAISSEGRHGVIITGQPGTGKTLFNYYLLVRLLQRKQVILFSPDGEMVFLFYQNEVYKATMAALSGYDESPHPYPIQSSSNVFIWSLFDIQEPREPRRFLVSYPCLPVQTTSPNPIRYKIWTKERVPLLASLPLWTPGELAQGLKYQAGYHSLLGALYEVYGSSSPSPNDPLSAYPGARKRLEEHYSEEDTVQPSPEDALQYLLDTAIERFGRSARDVFGAVFDFPGLTYFHEKAFPIRYTDLQDAVSALATNQVADQTVSHRILALHPIDVGPLMNVEWKVRFKSDWVRRSVLQKLGQQEDEAIRQQIRFFLRIPAARGVAGQMLEPLAHRYIADAIGDISLINMNSNDADSPTFTLVRDLPVPADVEFNKVKHEIVQFKDIPDLSTGLENDTYYIPMDDNFPMFDAFTVKIDDEEKSAILWVLQMTTSRSHGGSSRGYQKIRKIIGILKGRFGEGPPSKKSKTTTGPAISMPLIQARYLLVVPKEESESDDLKWQFPKGWKQNCKRHDHRGKVYCLEVPLSSLVTET